MRVRVGAVSFVFAVSALALMGCEPQEKPREEAVSEGASSAPEAPAVEKDERKAKARLVTLGGTVSEVVAELGHADAIVAVDVSSAYPESLSKLPQLGYYRKISAESILASKPTRVFASEGTGPDTALEQLRAAGVTVEIVPAGEGVEGARKRIEWLGEKLGEQEGAKKMLAELDADLAKVAAARAAATSKPRAVFIYARGPNMINVMGRGTSADAMLELAGIENAADVDGFKPLTPESVIEAAPDLLVLPTKGAKSVGGADGVFALPGVAQTPAGKAKRLVTVDDLKLMGFGPRMGEALLELQVSAGVSEEKDAQP